MVLQCFTMVYHGVNCSTVVIYLHTVVIPQYTTVHHGITIVIFQQRRTFAIAALCDSGPLR